MWRGLFASKPINNPSYFSFFCPRSTLEPLMISLVRGTLIGHPFTVKRYAFFCCWAVELGVWSDRDISQWRCSRKRFVYGGATHSLTSSLSPSGSGIYVFFPHSNLIRHLIILFKTGLGSLLTGYGLNCLFWSRAYRKAGRSLPTSPLWSSWLTSGPSFTPCWGQRSHFCQPPDGTREDVDLSERSCPARYHLFTAWWL